MFIDCVNDDPNGIAMRQIPFGSDKSSNVSLWISETGALRKRFHNIFNDVCTWSNLLIPNVDDNGKAYVRFGNKRLKIATAIALAWVPNTKNRKAPKLIHERDGEVATNLCWTDTESDCELEDNEEVWKNMDPAFDVSSHGRIRNARGEVSEGTFVGNQKLVCLPNKGVVNLQNIIDETFYGAKTKLCVKPRIERLLNYLKYGGTIEAYAEQYALKESTVWSYVYDVFVALNVDECTTIAERIISVSAWNAFQHIFQNETEAIFSQCAKDYMRAIDTFLCDDPEWKCNANRFQEIRLLKLLCEKESLSQ